MRGFLLLFLVLAPLSTALSDETQKVGRMEKPITNNRHKIPVRKELPCEVWRDGSRIEGGAEPRAEKSKEASGGVPGPCARV